MERIEKEIKRVLTEDIELPLKYKNIIRTTLKEKSKEPIINNKHRMVKILATGCVCVIVTTSIVYGKDISNFIQNFFNNSKGIDTAVENGYIEKLDEEYIKSSNTQVKIDNILMDDYNLNFTINIKFEENIDVENISKANIKDMIITDEENKILYCENQEKFNKYISEKNLKYTYKTFNENYINSGSNWYIKEKNSDEHSIKLVYNLFSSNYPKSKKIEINFNTISLNKENSEETEIKGEWNLNIDIPEKMSERENANYKVKNCSNPKVNVTKAIVNETCMKLELTIQEEKVYQEGDSQEVIKQKVEEKLNKEKEDFLAKGELQDIENVGLFSKSPYVETENGEKFYPTASNSEDSGTFNDYMTGLVTYWQTFNLTKYDATEKLKVHLKYKGEDILIELEK